MGILCLLGANSCEKRLMKVIILLLCRSFLSVGHPFFQKKKDWKVWGVLCNAPCKSIFALSFTVEITNYKA